MLFSKILNLSSKYNKVLPKKNIRGMITATKNVENIHKIIQKPKPAPLMQPATPSKGPGTITYDESKLYQHTSSQPADVLGRKYGSATSFQIRAWLELMNSKGYEPKENLTLVEVNLAKGDHKNLKFLDINKRGTVPVFSNGLKNISQTKEILIDLAKLNKVSTQDLNNFLEPEVFKQLALQSFYRQMLDFTIEVQSQNVPAVLNRAASSLGVVPTNETRKSFTEKNLVRYFDGMEDYLIQLKTFFVDHLNRNPFEDQETLYKEDILGALSESMLGVSFFSLMLHAERFSLSFDRYPLVAELYDRLLIKDYLQNARAEHQPEFEPFISNKNELPGTRPIFPDPSEPIPNELLMQSFISVPQDGLSFDSDDFHFTIQNIPFCSAKISNHVTGLDEFRICTRIGSKMIDIKGLVEKGFFDGFSQSISNALMQPNCDSLIQFDTQALESVRRRLQFILQFDTCLSTSDQHDLVYDKNDVILAKPFNPTSFHDGYTSLDHSDKIAKKFRGADASYMEHMKWFPNVYRGTHETFTASSRTFEPVKLNRPQGIIGEHQFGPDQDIDHEAEFGAVVHGTSTDDFTIERASKTIKGLFPVIDVSNRGIQKHEIPLGPLKGKDSMTVMGNYLVLPSALEIFKQPLSHEEIEFIQHCHPKIVGDSSIWEETMARHDINFEVFIQPEGASPQVLSQTSTRNGIWGLPPLIAHTYRGWTPARGVVATGTLSGPNDYEAGCLKELKDPAIVIGKNGKEERRSLSDGDQIFYSVYGTDNHSRITVGFGYIGFQLLASINQ